MSKSRETIETAYVLLDNTNLQKVRDGYDTRDLLSTIDELDELVRETRGEDGLRDMLLRLHAMAHTVVNGAPMAVSGGGHDSLPELATDVKMQLREAVLLFQKWIRRIEPLESPIPGD
jgi:hypothetical protein